MAVILLPLLLAAVAGTVVAVGSIVLADKLLAWRDRGKMAAHDHALSLIHEYNYEGKH